VDPANYAAFAETNWTFLTERESPEMYRLVRRTSPHRGDGSRCGGRHRGAAADATTSCRPAAHGRDWFTAEDGSVVTPRHVPAGPRRGRLAKVGPWRCA